MTKSLKRTILITAVCLLAAGCLVFVFGRKINVHFITPNGETVNRVRAGSLFSLPDGEQIEGYTFLGWTDENGNFVYQPVKLKKDAYYAARYATAFDNASHPPFLEVDNGQFRPDDALTVREAVNMFYALLNTDLIGCGSFSDVQSSDSCYQAAALLKDLGILAGNELHPNDEMTYAELKDILRGFFPEKALTDIPDADRLVSRRDAASVICSLTGRSGDCSNDYEKAGDFSDVSRDDQAFWKIAEACIRHEYSNTPDGECWESSIPGVITEEGFYFSGYDLHYIDENGSPALSTAIGHLQFDENGVWTSGDSVLDAEIKKILKEHVDPEMQSRAEMLRILYNHVRDDYEYCYGNDYMPGETGWANEEALKMIEKKIGNCYRFAGLFTVLARSIGYDAEEQCGVMMKDQYLHSWIEIPIDGEVRLFDPQYEARFQLGDPDYDRFNRGEDIMTFYNPMKEYRGLINVA